MRLQVRVPKSREAERRYVLAVVLGEFLGLEYDVTIEDRADVRIEADDEGHGAVHVADEFLATPDEAWLGPASLPASPLLRWRPVGRIPLAEPEVPILFGRAGSGEWLAQRGRERVFRIDIFGSAFFLLSRYEEIVMKQRDGHGRFFARASLAYREDFLRRPLVDEYVEILWSVLSDVWPTLVRRRTGFRVVPTHDVDWPLCCTGRSVSMVVRNAAGDLVRRHDARLSVRRIMAWLESRRGQFDGDPCNTFEFIMDESDRYGLTSAFYFICGHTGGAIDGAYDVASPWLRKLIRDIGVRGHEVGLHASYNTFTSPEETKSEFLKLVKVATEEGIRQSRWGGRQHYLRWENPSTWRNWHAAGLSYDSTLGYEDLNGFRCGTARDYATFDLLKRRALPLRERPLVFMEKTALGPMKLGLEAAARDALALARTCARIGIPFTFLWHNSRLCSAGEKRWYAWLIRECASLVPCSSEALPHE